MREGLTRHDLDPVVLQGGTPKKKRTAVIEALHETTDPILFLATFKTLGFTATQGAPVALRIERMEDPGRSPAANTSSSATTPTTDAHFSGFRENVGLTAIDRPSQITDDYWMYATDPNQPTTDDGPATTTTGKWQLFVARQHVDDAWATVAGLVRRGQLGPLAKVATTKENPNSPGQPDMHVIIVYANDWRDISDVRRILKTIRQAGLAKNWVHFKRDRETLAGAYGNRGHHGVSVWNARPGDHDQISTKWATGKSVAVTSDNSTEIVAAIERMDQGQIS
jgi:hypothetical protein